MEGGPFEDLKIFRKKISQTRKKGQGKSYSAEKMEGGVDFLHFGYIRKIPSFLRET